MDRSVTITGTIIFGAHSGLLIPFEDMAEMTTMFASITLDKAFLVFSAAWQSLLKTDVADLGDGFHICA